MNSTEGKLSVAVFGAPPLPRVILVRLVSAADFSALLASAVKGSYRPRLKPSDTSTSWRTAAMFPSFVYAGER